ncbi:MAG: TRAP transporter small permease subunit [Streptosporangiales bacterium]|nr:TRAP transporter small permease subunit [Streptosporangiales bacterium]
MAARRTGRKDFFLLRWIDALSEVSGYLSGACIFLATLIICYAVAVRALGGTTIWQTELAVYLLMFVTFIGGAYGLKHGDHVSVSVLVDRLPGRARSITLLVAAGLSLVIIAVVGWRSFDMWWMATERGWKSNTAWGPSLTFPYAILPLGMLLIGLQYLVIVARTIRTLLAGDDGQHDDEGGPE